MNRKGLRNILQRRMVVWALFGGLILFYLPLSYAATAGEINTSVDVALERFNKEVPGASEFLKTAKGLLILPGVVKAGLGIGGEYGEGALEIGGKPVDYYNVMSASFGLQIGAERKDVIIAFLTEEALSQFRKSNGWEAGVDGNIAFVNMGAGGRFDATTIKEPVVAFIFGVKGLMADVSLRGAKFTKLDKSKD